MNRIPSYSVHAVGSARLSTHPTATARSLGFRASFRSSSPIIASLVTLPRPATSVRADIFPKDGYESLHIFDRNL